MTTNSPQPRQPRFSRTHVRRTGIAVVAALATSLGAVTAGAAADEPVPTLPTSKEQCQHDGWRTFTAGFANQGDCIRYALIGCRGGSGVSSESDVSTRSLRPNDCP